MVPGAVAELRLVLCTPPHSRCIDQEEGIKFMGRNLRLIGSSSAAVVATALTLSACGGTNEYPGKFTVTNGDSEFYVGESFRYDAVTVKCTEKGGTITATFTESRTGNEFTTTQPDEGSGPAGGVLTLGESGEEFTWEVSDSGDEENPFENVQQSGQPVIWSDTGIMDFGKGLRQATTKSNEGSVCVQFPGQVDCSSGSEG